MTRNSFLRILGVTILTMVAAGRAHAAIPFDPIFVDPADGCGQELSVPDREYVLTGDLECPTASSGVLITASGVTFRLAGHTISSPVCDLSQNLAGIWVSGGVTGVEIEGGTVTGFNDGVLLYAAQSRVWGMTVTGACAWGIAVSGANNRLDTNHVTANGIDGVVLARATGTVVRSNDISGNTRDGVDISEFSHSNLIEQNIIRDNGSITGYGVAIYNGRGNTIRNNAVHGNHDGISIQSPGNTVEDNTVYRSTLIGISISQYGSASVVRRNTSMTNGWLDMSDATPGCGGNTWTDDRFVTDEVDGVPDGGPDAGCIK